MSFEDSGKDYEQVLTIEPLHHGYGTTIGNALRRVMLSSLEGAAVTAAKISGVQHEFSTMEGVKEDVLDVILNLKKLRLKVHSDEPVKLHLSVTGRDGAVTAKDIEANADVEIMNSDLTLATLTSSSATFEMDLTVARGRGFAPTEERDEEARDIGTIAVDALFSPVLNVGMSIENTRVGEITNYDKIIMNIQTDGTITPQDAVNQAIEIILNHYNWIEGQLNHSSLTEKIESAQAEAKEDERVEDASTDEAPQEDVE